MVVEFVVFPAAFKVGLQIHGAHEALDVRQLGHPHM